VTQVIFKNSTITNSIAIALNTFGRFRMTLRSPISIAEMLTHRLRLAGLGIASFPMTRARALLICQQPEICAPSRVLGAAAYLLERVDATEDEERLAYRAIDHTMDFRGRT